MEKSGNIIIIEAESSFKKVHKSLIENQEVDCLTLGIYVKLITLGKKWNLNIRGLSSYLNISDAKIRKSISVLERTGYIRRTPVRNEKGQCCGWNYEIYPTPIEENERSKAGYKTSGEMSSVLPENRQDGFPTMRITDNPENREGNNNRPNEHIDLKDHEETNKSLTKTANRDSAWRESMEEYLKEVEKAKEELIEDADFKKEFLGMFPNADYLRSIMKSMQYWTSEKAWELKKKSKTKKINMLSTLKNNLDKSIVYKNQQDAPIENLRKLDIEYSDQEEGTLADGTFIKNGYRYYFSYKDKRAYSIPIKAPRMPGEKCEFDMKTNQWYLPRESETMDEWLW